MRGRLVYRALFGSFWVWGVSSTCEGQASPDALLWNQVQEQILGTIAGIDKNKTYDRAVVQIPAVPLYALWNQEADGYNTLYQVADQVPRWGAVWLPSNRLFSTEYGSFVSFIDIPATSPAGKISEEKYETAQKAVTEESEKIKLRWARADAMQRRNVAQSLWTPQNVWIQRNSAKLSTLLASQNVAFTNWIQEVDPANFVITTEKKKFFDAFTPVSLVNVRLDPYPPKGPAAVPRYAPRLPFFGSTSVLDDVVKVGEANLAAGTSISWTFDSSDRTDRERKDSWSASGSYGPFVRAGGGRTTHTIDRTSGSLKLAVKAHELRIVPIGPEQTWYSQFLLDHFKCGPFRKSRSKVVVTPSALWGKDGSLSLAPTAVVVAYKPIVTASMDNATYSFYQSKSSAGGGFSLGPFSLGGGGSSVSTEIRETGTARTVTSATTSPTPQIWAVIYERINFNTACD